MLQYIWIRFLKKHMVTVAEKFVDKGMNLVTGSAGIGYVKGVSAMPIPLREFSMREHGICDNIET